MSRQEEFNDIPSLGSARDEMDHGEIPTLKPATDAKKAPGPISVEKPSKTLPHSLVILLLAAIGGLGYWSFDQITKLELKLSAAELAVAQSQNRIADIEALVSAADESANKSGVALQAKLRQQLQEGKARVEHVDAEIGKLWAIYQKYKPIIAALEKQQQAHGEELASQRSELRTVGGSLDTIGLSLDQQTQSLNKTKESVSEITTDLASLETNLSTVEKELSSIQAGGDKKLEQQQETFLRQLRDQDLANQEVDDLQAAQLSDIQNSIRALRAKPQLPADLQKQIAEHQAALESITIFRKQVNSELLKLRQRIGRLQTSSASQ
ncbi:hypothetical protein [Motiliproteus sp. MSK22-1]|uniref:hypothetical protein n=1 Tax=Motiliproteus sp. MSK22-1 TaxID=1897630 RepID=UPI0009759B4D|nr:hypothetical protein [Motiliproteus sp. MSK22-1]OMH30337.1 hypothetical protein BGP75_18300 [Motiliproteus sp. MSK22-1]